MMGPTKKRNLARRILALREQMKTADEALTANLNELAPAMAPGETITVEGKSYELRDIFAEGNATWRPARVHRFSLAEKRGEK